MTPATGQDESAGGHTSDVADQTQASEDERLLTELRQAVARFDPPPLLSTAEFGLGVLSWRDPDAELAALVADSRELADAVRGGNREVLLRFEVSPYAITLEASPDASGRYRVIGQVEPGVAGRVDIRQSVRPRAARTLGALRPVGQVRGLSSSRRPVSLRLTPDTGHPVRTTWVVL